MVSFAELRAWLTKPPEEPGTARSIKSDIKHVLSLEVCLCTYRTCVEAANQGGGGGMHFQTKKKIPNNYQMYFDLEYVY